MTIYVAIWPAITLLICAAICIALALNASYRSGVDAERKRQDAKYREMLAAERADDVRILAERKKWLVEIGKWQETLRED